MRSRASAGGSVLLVSVWAVGMLASLTVAQAVRVALQARVVGRGEEAALAAAAVRTGVAYAQWQVATDPDLTWDGSSEAWAHPGRWGVGLTEDRQGWGAQSLGEEETLRVRIRDAQGTISINDADDAMLARLPQVMGISLPRFAEQVRAAMAPGPDGRPRPILYLEELIPRAAVPPSAVEALRAVARTTGPKAVNLNAVSPAVLKILGVPATFADTFCRQRDGAEGAADDAVFRTADEVRAFLQRLGYDAQAPEYLAIERLLAEGWAGVASSVFQVEVVGVSGRHGVRRAAVALVTRAEEGAAPVVQWQEHRGGDDDS